MTVGNREQVSLANQGYGCRWHKLAVSCFGIRFMIAGWPVRIYQEISIEASHHERGPWLGARSAAAIGALFDPRELALVRRGPRVRAAAWSARHWRRSASGFRCLAWRAGANIPQCGDLLRIRDGRGVLNLARGTRRF